MKSLNLFLILVLSARAFAAREEDDPGRCPRVFKHVRDFVEERVLVDAAPKKVRPITKRHLANLSYPEKVKLFLSKRSKGFWAFAIAPVMGAIGAAYSEELSGTFNDYVKKPAREVEKKFYVTHVLGGAEKLDGMIAGFRAQTDGILRDDWGKQTHDEQIANIAKSEQAFKTFLAPFRPYSPWNEQDLLSKKTFFTDLGAQILSTESIYSQARAQLRGQMNADDRSALQVVLNTSLKQLDDAVSLWNVYVAASPDAEIGKMDPTLRKTYEMAREFVMTHTDLDVYRNSLIDRAKETADAVKDVEK